MKGICPNINLKEWQDSVTKYGKDIALIIFDQLGGRVPSEGELNVLAKEGSLDAGHNQRVWDVNKAEGLVDTKKWSTVDGLPRPDTKYFFRKKADDMVRELNTRYALEKGEMYFERGTPVKGKFPVKAYDRRFVGDLNELHNLHIVRNQQRADLAAEDAARNAEANGLPEESRKLQGIQTEPETKEGLKSKIAVLQKAIPYITTVMYDETIMSIAVVEAGGRTIRINPTLMTTDSIGHEYGHVLIDILGGMSNPMIKLGREQLKGSDIEKSVMAAYPELVQRNDDRIDKEILTTAVGLKVAELFKDQEQQNKWLRWLVRFMRRLRAMLGIESSVVLDLAQRLVYGEEVKTKERASVEDKQAGMYIQGAVSRYDQYSKKLGDSLTLIDKLIVEEEKLQTKAVKALSKKLEVYSKKGKETPEYKALEETMPRLQGLNPTKSLIHMIRFAVESTKQMNDKYIEYQKNVRYPKNKELSQGKIPNAEPMTAKLLSEWRTSVASWDMLEDLRRLYDDVRGQVDAFGEASDQKALTQMFYENKALLQAIIGEKEFKKLTGGKVVNILDLLIPMLDEAIAVKNKIQQLYIDKGKELIVDYLFPYVNHVKVLKREEYERKWLDMTPEEQKGLTKAQYIMQQLNENLHQIEKETRDLILRELGKAEGDVGFLTRYIDTILDSRDVISSALARAVFDIQEKSNLQILEYKYQFVDRVTALEKQLGRTIGVPDEKFWDWMIETDPDTGRPLQNIISSLPSKLINDFWDLYNQVMSDTYKNNNGIKPSDDQKRRIIYEWKEKNAPRDKEAWLNARIELANKLQEEGIITDKEKARYISNAKVTTREVRVPIAKIFKTQNARDIVDSFERRNEWTFRNPSGYYKKINAKWYALEAIRKSNPNDERVKFYDFITETIDQAAARLPGKYSLTTELPSMMKTMGQRYKASGALGMSKADFLKYEFNAKFKKQNTDTDKGGLLNTPDEELNAVGKEKKEAAKAEGVVEGTEKSELVNEANEPVYFLPIYYTQNKTHDVGQKLPIYDQSFDIASLYFNYIKMAVDFGNKYEVLAELEMTNYFINDRDVIRRDAKGNIITDATAKKIRRIGESIRDKALVDSGRKSMLAAQVADFLKANIYGMEHDEEPDVNIFGFTMDRAKALDALNSFTALNMLGMNFVAGIANVNLGEITQINEAFAGQYTTIKDLKNATGYYYKNLGGIMNDIGMRRPTNIVSLLNERFTTLNEEIDGKININSRFANLMNTNTLFFTSHAGEHYMQTRFMLAMLKTLKAYDKDGNDLGSMLDHISVDEETNRLKIDEKVANFTEADQTAFSARMHRVLTAMHGEYSKIGQSALQRQALGRMAILFRRFIVPGFKRRWEKKGINNLLDDSTEGYYITFGRLAKQFMVDYMHFKFEAMEAMGRKGKYKMTDMERANMVRLAGEMTAFAITVIMAAILMRAKADDDDKDNLFLNNAAYQAMRLRAELLFFLNPMATMQILRSPMATMSLLENTLKLMGQVMYPLYSGTLEFQEYQQGSWKGHLKLAKTFNNILPVYKQWDRVTNIGDQLSWFQQ